MHLHYPDTDVMNTHNHSLETHDTNVYIHFLESLEMNTHIHSLETHGNEYPHSFSGDKWNEYPHSFTDTR